MDAFKNNIPLYTIHDCFATIPNNMELIKKTNKSQKTFL